MVLWEKGGSVFLTIKGLFSLIFNEIFKCGNWKKHSRLAFNQKVH